MMMVHGWQKIQGFSRMSQAFPDPFGVGSPLSLTLAIGAEFFCSILVILGVALPLALVPLIVTMLVAIFVAHGSDPWQKKELASCYLATYLTLLASGAGGYSVDGWLRRRASQ